MKKTREAEQMVLKGTEEDELLIRLSEKVERAIAAIQELRRERDALSERLAQAELRHSEQQVDASRLLSVESECERFRSERGEIKNRVEGILAKLERLDELVGE